MTETPPGLPEIRDAAARIAGRVRRTPTMGTEAVSEAPGPAPVTLKLECLQVTGSFKPRGATNCLLQQTPEAVARGIVTASGGNHGLAVAYAGHSVGAGAGTRAVVYLPETTSSAKADAIRAWGAEVVVEGAAWDDANRAALARAARDGLTYIHPLADPRVIAGQGTVGLEFLEDAPDLDLLIVAIGGGGLISGVALAAKALKPDIRVVGVEPVGAPTLTAALAAGAPVTLPRIETAAGTLAPGRSAQINLDIIRDHVDEIVLVDDAEMKDAARWLWREMAVAAELSGAAALAALRQGRVRVAPAERVGVLVCGAGRDGLD
jgi:threonine dehydratase